MMKYCFTTWFEFIYNNFKIYYQKQNPLTENNYILCKELAEYNNNVK